MIPHKNKRFPGYVPADPTDKSSNDEYNAEEHKKQIFGGHVADYMRQLSEEDDEKYKRQFSRFIKNGIGADDLEGLYSKVHAEIRKNPDGKKAAKKASYKPKKRFNAAKLTYEQRVAKRPRLEDL